ncbi:bifunctional diguanylate cyclase/phosphodiesterase [Lacticaseibacillus sp. GG6-2]
MALGTWLGRLVTSIFFVAGYLTYYDTNVYLRLRGGDTFWRRLRNGVLSKLVLISVLLCLQAAILTVFQGSEMYINLLLFAAAYPVLDETNSLADYLWYWAQFSLVWYINHPFQPQLFVLVAVILAITCIVVRRYQSQFHYNAAPNLILFSTLGILAWMTRVHMTTASQWRFAIIFIAMSSYAYTYIRRVHKHAQERAKLSNSLMYDALTHAYSLTRMRKQGVAAFKRCQQEQQPMAAAVLDIDYFKSINDEFGHAAGDEVLISVTRLLQRQLAQAPIAAALYRTGGEEMTILMPDSTLEQAVQLVRNCWTAVRTVPIPYAHDHLRCSMSIGVAYLERSDATLDDLLKRADDSLYLSKQNGRDRITVDGRADLLNNSHSVMINYTYYTQPVMQIKDSTVITNELRLSVYADGHWGDAPDFSVTLETMMALIAKIHSQLETPALAVNFTCGQLVKPRIKAALIAYVKKHRHAFNFHVELKEMPDATLFAQQAPDYLASGIHFVIDGCTTPAQFKAFAPVIQYFDAVKIPLIAKPTPDQLTAMHANLKFWQDTCEQHDMKMVLVGIESDAGLRLCDRYNAAFGQGNYFSRPVLPRIL